MSVDIAADINLQDELILDEGALTALFTEARTANSFAPDEISDETLQAVYALTKMGPTAMNIQPLRITWVRSAEARERLVSHMADGNKAKTQAAPVVAILSYDTDWHELMETTAPHAAGMAPTFGGNEPLRTAMANNNSHLQAGFFIMAARAAGLATGPMGGYDNAGLDADFFAGTPQKSIMVVNLGKPNGIIDRPRLERLDYDVATATV